MKHLESSGHLIAVQIAFLPHHVFKKGDFAFRDEKHQFSGFREISLRRQQGEAFKAVVPVSCHGGCRNDGQRPAQTISHQVNADLGQNGANGIDSSHGAQPVIIIHSQIAVGCIRIAPRNHEYRMSLPNQPVHQRVAG